MLLRVRTSDLGLSLRRLFQRSRVCYTAGQVSDNARSAQIPDPRLPESAATNGHLNGHLRAVFVACVEQKLDQRVEPVKQIVYVCRRLNRRSIGFEMGGEITVHDNLYFSAAPGHSYEGLFW